MRPYWKIAMLFLVISLVDLLVTLRLLDRGAEEWNPLLGWALTKGTGWFVGIKLALTILSSTLLFLVPSRSQRGDWFIALGLAAYAFVFVQHGRGLSILGW